MGVTKRFRNYFFRGLAVLLPSILTIWIFVFGYRFLQTNISVHVNRGLVHLIALIQGESGIGRERLTEIFVDGAGSVVGFLFALVAVCIVGALLASVVGKTLWRMVETFIMNTPFLKTVYPYVKQITDFLFARADKERIFSRVVAVEYPRKGIWSLGMVTGTGLKKVSDSLRKEILAVLIPTSPTPFTGFVIMVPKEQTIELDMTIEEALRFTISGGVITPSVQLDERDVLTLPNVEPKDKQ